MKKIALCLMLWAMLGAMPATGFAQSKINKKNMVIKEWKTDARSSLKTLDHSTTYSADGKKLEEIEYDKTSTKQKWRKRYEYGNDGRVSRELVYDERNRLTVVKKFEYNEYGRKKTMSTYNAKGKLQSVKTYEYIVEK